MKILLTNDAANIAGGENYVLHLAEGLSGRGHEILIAPLINSELEEAAKRKGFETIGVPYGAHGKEYKAISFLIESIKDKKIDIVHSNSNLDRTIAAVAGKMISAKNISSIHSCLSISRNIIHWYRNKYLINHFTPVGFSTKKILIEIDKIPSDKITVVHIGIPEGRIQKTEEGRMKIRKEFNINEREIVIGTLSRLVEFKGHKFLLKAFSELKNEFKDCTKLMISGEGELKEKLVQQAMELNIQNKVIFTGIRNDVSNILSAFDIFSQFSVDAGGETFPVALIEALAAELPVVGSLVGDIEYLIDNNKNGYLVEPENLSQYTEAIEKLISSNDLRKNMGKGSHIKYLNEFTLNKMIANMEEVYKKVIP